MGEVQKNISDIKALDNFAMQNLHDDMKRQYAKDNGYKLIEIPYTEDTQEKVNKYIEKCLKGV